MTVGCLEPSTLLVTLVPSAQIPRYEGQEGCMQEGRLEDHTVTI